MPKRSHLHTMRLSSRLTFFYKVFFPLAGMSVVFSVTSDNTISGLFDWVFSVLFAILFVSLLWWFFGRLKAVRIEGGDLVVSNYLKTIRIPLREMVEIDWTPFISPANACIHLRDETPFGRKIVFMLPVSLSLFSHPVVDRLRRIIMLRIDGI